MSDKHIQSESAFQRACRVLVGGVDSPVRAYAAVGGHPPFIASANGATLTDVDGNDYIDYVGSYGPLILGHAHPAVVEAVQKAARNGMSFGAPTETEAELAELILSRLNGAEKVRFVNSGTEATMTAIRLARGATGRNKIVKFIGGYHGHSDALLVSAGSGAATLGVPSSPGVPSGAIEDTLLADYNDIAAVEALFESHGSQIAAALIEPVAGNMGVIPPIDGFLESLHELCSSHGSLLIFDEVMTGFRVGPRCAQGLFDITPDLTCLGKIIGGGLPVGAVAGPTALMDHLAPLGPVYQAGTLSGNPLAMAAGLATLKLLNDDFYRRLEDNAAALQRGLQNALNNVQMEKQACIQRIGSMLTLFFHPGPVQNYAQAAASHLQTFAAWFNAMLDNGVFLPPSQFEAFFVSAAHNAHTIKSTIQAAQNALNAIVE